MLGRLALMRGGEAVDDPLAWYDTLSDEAVRFWDAYWRHEPWGGHWEQHAQSCQLFSAANKATDSPVPELAEFMPQDWERPKPEAEAAPIEKQLAVVQKALT
jgi:hypothetical protein